MKKDEGFDCEPQPDGTRICKRYKIKRRGVYSTGTDVELIPDSETCKVSVKGRVNDEDKEAVSQEIKDMESKCRKGF